MSDSFGELEAASLFCPRCKQANPVRKALLLVLPDGFEYTEAEIGNTVECRTSGEAPLALTLDNTYAQLNAFEWSNAA